MSRKRYESDIYTIKNAHMSSESDVITNIGTRKCELCNGFGDSKFIILNCSHLFHVKCIVDYNLKDVYKYETIDEAYFSNTKCSVCTNIIDKEDLLIMYTKYMSSTDSTLLEFSNNLDVLDAELKNLRDEIKAKLCEKHKLQQSREKSKHIISLLDVS
jgi:hypothetical protein